MKRNAVCCQRLVIAIFAISALMVSSVVAFAEAPGCAQGRQSENELSQEWWQLIFSLPPAVNLATDPDGTSCVVGQRGDVWFLAGNFTGAPALTRTCTVPEDKAFFFPVINQAQFDSPNACGQGSDSMTVEEMRANIAPLINEATNVSVTLDGRKVGNIKRIRSDVFDVSLPADNVYGMADCAGTWSPTVDDGYYAHVGPLKPGSHTLQIYAKSGDFVVDVTYHLNVVPVKLK